MKIAGRSPKRWGSILNLSIFHPRPSYLKPNRSNVPSFSISSRNRRSMSCCADNFQRARIGSRNLL